MIARSAAARYGWLVPRVSEFFGMSVYMYWFDTQKHQKEIPWVTPLR